MNKLLTFFLLLFLTLLPSIPLYAEEVLLKGGVERVIPSGTPIKLRITSLPMNQEGLYMENWDWEGNFIPPKLNDPIMSQLSEDIYIGRDLVLPKGTQFYGKVSKVIPPKRFGRDGRLEISFEGLKTPSGKSLQFEQAATTLSGRTVSKGQNAARGTARAATYALGGAAAGALVSTQVAGLILTSMNPQYIIGTGAGVGLLVGVVASIVKKGKPGSLMPGDEISVQIEQNIMLPVAEKIQEKPPEKFSIEGLQIQILGRKLARDDLGINIFLIDLEIVNNTQATFFGSDFLLLGPHNRQFLPGGLSLALREGRKNTFLNLMSEKIGPGQKLKGQIAFEIQLPGFEHTLILKEHYRQQPVFKDTLGIPANFEEQRKLFNLKNKIFGENSDPWN